MSIFKTFLNTAALCGLLTYSAYAQDISLLSNNVDDLLRAESADRDNEAVALLDQLSSAFDSHVSGDKQSRRALLDFYAGNRTDIQNGASGAASGSTSAVLNPVLPSIFGVSFENGAITRSISGNTVTLSANLARLICSTRIDASGEGLPVYLRRPEDCQLPLQQFSLAAVFDTSRGKTPDSAAGKLSALGNQFASISVRYEIYNERRPSSARFQSVLNDWEVKAKQQANLDVMIGSILSQKRQARRAELVQLVGKTMDDTAKRKAVEDLLRRYIGESQAEVENRLPGIISKARAAWFATLRADNRLYNTAAHGWVVSGEYSNQRPDIATDAIGTIVAAGTRPPALHTGRLIVARGLSSYRLDFTGNFSSSWFASVRPGMPGAWRDIQASGDVKIELRKVANWGTPVLRFAGLWMNLRQPPLGLGINAFNDAKIDKPGNIGLFQAKLEVPTANSAITVPISFTYSNRTDLIKEKEVRAQIGISLNLDGIFSGGSK